MGALAGVLGTVSDREIAAMVERQRHRGRRVHIARFDGLTVASIANEPESRIRSAGRTAIVCDVGVLNDADLRARSSPPNGGLADDSPAELLLATYMAHGPSGLEAADGNFAFALVDHEKREIVLGRDFFGSAPLYYTILAGGEIAFASEYKALLSLSGMEPQVDLDMVQYLQCTRKLPPHRTLLSNVHAIRPGSVTRLNFDGRELETHLSPPLRVDVADRSESETAELVRSELKNALRRSCRDEERIGVALSGGIDSIAVACLVRELFPERDLHTFTAGNDPDDPELITARRVAQKIGARHHDVITTAELVSTELRSLVWHLEDPSAWCDALQLFEVGRAAGDHVDVLLSGQGADSLFGGMPRYKMLKLMKPFLRLPFLRKPLTEFYNLTQLGLKPKSPFGRALDWLYFRDSVPAVPAVRGAHGLPEPIELPAVGPEFVNAAMARGFQNGQCQDYPKYERSFAAWGVAHRSPYCDVAFARSVYSISDSLKIRGGIQKYILREAMRSVVPDEFLQVPKFMQTLRQDTAFSDTLDELCSAVLSDSAVKKRGYFDYSAIEKLRHRSPGKPYRREAAMRLWTALTTELWAQEFLDRRGRGPER
jgi:asparagine synthase (glutamine-hydrolysing)